MRARTRTPRKDACCRFLMRECYAPACANDVLRSRRVRRRVRQDARARARQAAEAKMRA